MDAVWPFVGRDDELQRLGALVTAGVRRGALLAGPAGVGKTRLAVECLRRVERAGLATVQATATRSARSLPLGAFSGLIAASDPPAGSDRDRADMLHRFAAHLVEHSAGRRLVVFVDDAHLLDDMSATLVHQLATTDIAFVLITMRSGTPTPDPVMSLWKNSLAERLELAGLGHESVAELLAAVLGGPVDERSVSQLVDRSRGNLLFLRELVRGAMHDGVLVEDAGLWRLTGALAPSHRLVELVEARLDDVTPAERAVLELVSLGEPLGDAELTSLADPAIAEDLERRELLTSTTNGRRLEIRLAHPIYRDVLRSRIPTVRRRAIVRALAEVAESRGARRRDDALRVASWWLVGGGGRPDVLLAGAREARWRYDFPVAEQLARGAMTSGAGFDAALLAAEVAGLLGRSDEAERELAALATQASDDAQRGAVAIARIHNSVAWTGQDAGRIIDEAESAIVEPRWQDRLAAERLVLLDVTRGPRATVEAARPLLDDTSAEAVAVACIPAATSLGRLGRLDAATAATSRGHEAHRAAGEPLAWYPWWHLVSQCRILQWAGQFEEAEALAAAQHRRALAEGSAEAQAMFALVPALAVLARGRVLTAIRRTGEALAIARALNRPLLVRRCLAYGALASALAGRGDEAEEALTELEALPIPAVLDDVAVLTACAWVDYAAGDVSEAHRHLKQAAALGEEIGDLVGASVALHGVARLGRAAEVRDNLAEVVAQIEGCLAPARLAHVTALAGRDPRELETVSRELEAMGADLLAAEAAADAGVVRRQAGETRAAGADQRRARILMARCEGPVTPSLQAVEARARLTAAERETALLAAAGLTNRQIAARLYLSVRTVENRLLRVYEKLGISRRTDLPQALDMEETPPS